MAKLTGVQTLEMVGGDITKIEYKGEVYGKVADGNPKIGDIGRFNDDSSFCGEFTEITSVDEEGDPITCEEHGGSWYSNYLDYFRKVDGVPSGLTKVDSPQIGGYVVFGEDFLDTTAGKMYKITEVESDGDFSFIDDVDDLHGINNGRKDVTAFYVKQTQSSRLDPTSGALKGDIVEMTTDDTFGDYKKGDQFIVRVGGSGDEYIRDNAGDHRYINAPYNPHLQYKVVEGAEAANVGESASGELKEGVTIEMKDDCGGGGFKVGDRFKVKKNERGTLYFNDKDGSIRVYPLDCPERFKVISEELFAKVNRPDNMPIVGDFVTFNEARIAFHTHGKKYEIERVDCDGDPEYKDDDGDFDCIASYDSDEIEAIYVKYTQEQADQKAKKGDKILVVNSDEFPFNEYTNGDILTVSRGDLGGVIGYEVKADKSRLIGLDEFIVLTDDQVGGEKAEETEEKYTPQEGDIVVITGNTNDSRNKVGDIGKVGEITKWDADHELARVYVEGRGVLPEANDCYTRHYEMRPATDEEKSQYLRETGKVPKVGDKVRLLAGGGSFPLIGYKDGEIYTVGDITQSLTWYDDGQTHILIEGGTESRGYPLISQVEVVEEVAEAKSEEESLSDGDYAVILDTADEGRLYRGDVVRLEKLDDSIMYNFRGVRVEDDRTEVFESDELRLATQEEIAETLGHNDVQVGDKIEVLADNHTFLNKGGVHTVTVNDMEEDGMIKVDCGDWLMAFTSGKPRFKVVEKAKKEAKKPTESPTQEDSNPYGNLEVGDKVMVVIADGERPKHSWGKVENGEIGKVTDTDYLGAIKVDFPSQTNWSALESELIKVADNGDLLPGTLVKVNGIGDVLELAERRETIITRYGTSYNIAGRCSWIGDKQFEVLTKSEAQSPAEEEDSFSEGDIVAVVCGAYSTLSDGDVGEITEIGEDPTGGEEVFYRVTVPGKRNISNFQTAADIRYATPEEKAEFERKQQPSKIEVGDLVRVVLDSHPLCGETLRVVSDDYDYWFPLDTEELDGTPSDCFKEEHLEVVVKAAQAEDEPTGEKSEEDVSIEPGDLVKVVSSPCALPIGTYFVVKHVRDCGRIESAYGDGVYDKGQGIYFVYDDVDLELIAKAAEVYA